MPPFAIALPTRRRARLRRISGYPLLHVEIIVLLAPDHAGEGLPLDQARVRVLNAVLQLRVELVGLSDARGKDLVEVGERLGHMRPAQPQPQLCAAASRHIESVPSGRLGALRARI